MGHKELQGGDSVELARIEKHIVLTTGPWTIFLPIDKESRYPRTEEIIPAESKVTTRCTIAVADAAFLASGLPRLPGAVEDDAPVTLDLNGEFLVRAKGEGPQRATELVLAQSEVDGVPVRLKTNRTFLVRALRLGFTELHVVNADTPTLCRDERRIYVWMPLGKDGAIPPSDDAVRIHSTEATRGRPHKERTTPVMTPASENVQPAPSRKRVQTNGQASKSTTFAALIEDAQNLRTALREAYSRSNRLVTALKKQRKQSQLLKTTLASLRQLQHIEQ